MSLKIGPFTVSRGALIPYNETFETDQTKMKDGDGGAVVVSRPYVNTMIRVTIKVPRDEARMIANYLAHNVKFAGLPLTLVDGLGTTRTVRFWDDKVNKKYLAGGSLVQMNLLFREEV